MARVFLSYDREDEEKARLLAGAIEKAGHSVWWDRHIRSGAQYSKEIEQALRTADALVVLWSKRSVDSPWVRDEAAAGRDSGRLIPVRLDSNEPPLGFRQFQTIDLSRWKGRGKPAQLPTLLADIDALATGSSATPPAAPVPAERPARRRPTRRLVAVALLIAALLVAGLVAWRLIGKPSPIPLVAVAATETSPASTALARDLFVQLGRLQATNADALHLVEPESNAAPDFTLKVGAMGEAANARANVSLIDNRSGTLLWSREFAQPSGNQTDLRLQTAYSTGQVLRCVTEALAPTHRGLRLVTLKLYLHGCSDLSDLLAQDSRVAIPTFRKVVEQAPTFAGGWAKLILAELTAFQQTNFSDAGMRRDLRAHIDHARKAHPNIAEPALAEAWLQTPRPISGWMRFADEAVASDPNHAEALMNRATGLMHVGRMREAVSDAKRAAQAEPLYLAARGTLVEALAHSGAIADARSELREVERLWPGASSLPAMRLLLEYRYGDARAAMRILESGKVGLPPTKAGFSFLAARIDPSPSKIDKAISDARTEYRFGTSSFSSYVQTMAFFGRGDEAAEALLSVDTRGVEGVILALFRPYFSDLRRDRQFMAISKRFGLILYWQETGRWPDFCFEPDLPYDCKAEAAKLGG